MEVWLDWPSLAPAAAGGATVICSILQQKKLFWCGSQQKKKNSIAKRATDVASSAYLLFAYRNLIAIQCKWNIY